MRILITGVNGQLGHDLCNELISRGHSVVGSDISDIYSGINDGSPVCFNAYARMDITNEEEVQSVLTNVLPEAVIHCAAWTAVDLAEKAENREKVRKINKTGTENIAKFCKEQNIKMMYLSTDYVFDGTGTEPWKPENEAYSPLNYYGETKLDGEKTVKGLCSKFFIIRIAWVFGLSGNNFVKTMLRVGKANKTVRVVCDQIGTPTYTRDLAKLLSDMIVTEKYGIYHATNEGGFISWYEFAKEIFRLSDYDTQVIPVTTEEYGISIAKRPYNSRLDKEKLERMGFRRLPSWKDALKRYLEEIN